MSKVLIQIHGLIGHGKDTTAQMLAQKLKVIGYFTARVSNADPLKRATEQMLRNFPLKRVDDEFSYSEAVYDFTREQKQQIISDELPITLGQYMQKLGEGLRQIYGEDYWVNLRKQNVTNRFSGFISTCQAFFTTDIRYPNELISIEGFHTLNIKVVRPQHEESGRDNKHVSEAGLPDSLFDYVLVNDKGLSELELMITNILHEKFDVKGYGHFKTS